MGHFHFGQYLDNLNGFNNLLSIERKFFIVAKFEKHHFMEEEEIAYKVVAKVFEVKMGDIHLHPKVLQIYDYNGKRDAKVLAKTMKMSGQLEPIVINRKNQIIAGTRRYKLHYF